MRRWESRNLTLQTTPPSSLRAPGSFKYFFAFVHFFGLFAKPEKMKKGQPNTPGNGCRSENALIFFLIFLFLMAFAQQ